MEQTNIQIYILLLFCKYKNCFHLYSRTCGDSWHHPQSFFHRSFTWGTREGLFPAPSILPLVLLGLGGWLGRLHGQFWSVGVPQVGVEVGCFSFYLKIRNSKRFWNISSIIGNKQKETIIKKYLKIIFDAKV